MILCYCSSAVLTRKSSYICLATGFIFIWKHFYLKTCQDWNYSFLNYLYIYLLPKLLWDLKQSCSVWDINVLPRYKKARDKVLCYPSSLHWLLIFSRTGLKCSQIQKADTFCIDFHSLHSDTANIIAVKFYSQSFLGLETTLLGFEQHLEGLIRQKHYWKLLAQLVYCWSWAIISHKIIVDDVYS